MPYRKVTYAEQVWYLLRYKLKTLCRRKVKKCRKHPEDRAV